MKFENNLQNNIEQVFNTDPLLNDLNNVIQNGLNKLLNNYITNYKLYEETHNCIMNLPSVKREIAKKSELNEVYDDLPDLISISSDDDNEYEYGNYNRIPTEDESDQESEDTLLCMKKVANQLLKEKQEMITSYIEKEKSYKEKYDNEIADLKNRMDTFYEESIMKYDLLYKQKALCDTTIEKYSKEIDDLKNQLNNCVKQPLVCDLTSDNNNSDEEAFDEPNQLQEVIEIKQEKENIILHIEEESEAEASEAEEDVEEDEASEADEEDVEEQDEDEASEAEEDLEEDEASEAEEDLEEDVEEEASETDEESSEIEDQDVVEEAELCEDEVETEKSESEEEKDENEDAEEELIEIEIDGVTYCTENEDNGFIYELDSDGNVGETVGYLKDGEPFFN
jgi:hypothetical protein